MIAAQTLSACPPRHLRNDTKRADPTMPHYSAANHVEHQCQCESHGSFGTVLTIVLRYSVSLCSLIMDGCLEFDLLRFGNIIGRVGPFDVPEQIVIQFPCLKTRGCRSC